MKNYKYSNGLSESGKKAALLANPYVSFVKTTDGETFYYSRINNDSVKPCYKVVINSYNGERLNANLNNGIAYKTNL